MKDLLTKAELLDKSSVAFDVDLLKVLQKISSVTDHLQKTSSGMVVMGMLFQVTVQVVDPLGEDRDLDFRRTGVAFMSGKLFDDFLFFLLCHLFHLISIFADFPGNGR